jgi:Tfp pilus assembly protein PilX
MPKEASSINKGVALLLVLMVILVAVIIANISLTFILSQSRLTHHEISRIQAYYACQAGVNYALEKLRTGDWSTGSYSLCSSGCTVNDGDIPYRVDITIGDTGSGINNTRRISATATYTYTP